MDRSSHLIISFIFAGILLFVFYGGHDSPFIIQIILGTGIGTLLPDILEPATHWAHRKNLHSKEVLRITSIFFIIFILSTIIFQQNLNMFLTFFFLGYTSHLLADSITKVGLPNWN